MTQPVRIGLIGFGRVARTYLRWHERLRWQGIVEHVIACDLLEQHRDDALNIYGFTHFTTDYEDVISRSDVDLVLIYTSMQTHGAIALAALAAGKHVQVEKPFAPNLEIAARLVAAARTSPGYLVPAPYSILSPTYRTLWTRIHNGDIGHPRMARAFYGHSGPTWGPWFYQQGGGAMFDLGVYNVTSLTGLLGPAKRVMAMSGSAVDTRVINGQTIPVEADDNSHTLIDFGIRSIAPQALRSMAAGGRFNCWVMTFARVAMNYGKTIPVRGRSLPRRIPNGHGQMGCGIRSNVSERVIARLSRQSTPTMSLKLC